MNSKTSGGETLRAVFVTTALASSGFSSFGTTVVAPESSGVAGRGSTLYRGHMPVTRPVPNAKLSGAESSRVEGVAACWTAGALRT